MSTEYSLRCLTCGVDEPDGYTWDKRALKYLITLSAPMKALIEADEHGIVVVVFASYYDGVMNSPRPIEFAVEHYGHDVRVFDEYGREWIE